MADDPRLPSGLESALAAAGASLEARLAVVETRIVDHHAELMMMRQRFHTLEADRATIQLLAQDLSRVRSEYGSLRADVHEIAKDAARVVIDEVFERRDDLAVSAGVTRRSWVSIGIQFGSLMVAAAASLAAVVLALTQ